MIEKHKIDDESRIVHFNASLKAINEKWGTIANMTIFYNFGRRL